MSWDGKVTLGARFYPEGPLAAADVALAGKIMSDQAYNLVPWMRVQVRSCAAVAAADSWHRCLSATADACER